MPAVRMGIIYVMPAMPERESGDYGRMRQEHIQKPCSHYAGIDDESLYIHAWAGHHVMVGAALLTAYRNSGGKIDLDAALQEMKARGSEYPGGACGLWGCCGAAVSTGMFMSITTKATPLTGRSWKLSNLMTSRALKSIAQLGGPRCCKRDSFTAAIAAVELVKEELGVEMELPEKITCDFSNENEQCLKKHCPYHRISC